MGSLLCSLEVVSSPPVPPPQQFSGNMALASIISGCAPGSAGGNPDSIIFQWPHDDSQVAMLVRIRVKAGLSFSSRLGDLEQSSPHTSAQQGQPWGAQHGAASLRVPRQNWSSSRVVHGCTEGFSVGVKHLSYGYVWVRQDQHCFRFWHPHLAHGRGSEVSQTQE